MIHVDSIELFWIGINATALVLTVWALTDAWSTRTAVRVLNGKAREIVATTNVVREAIRVVIQLLLLSIVVPGVFSDRPIVLSPILIALILVPVFLLANTVLDVRARRRLMAVLRAGE